MFVHALPFLKVHIFFTLVLVCIYDSDTISKFKNDNNSKFKNILKVY